MQPKEHTHTTKDLSSEEVKPSSIHLDERMKYRKVNSELLQRAWHTVHRIAAMLYKDFGASQVAVFGSLAEGYWFSTESDIDIAVWGIQGDTYHDAVWETRNFSTEFRIDLVNYHSANGRFCDRIQNQAILIQTQKTGIDNISIDNQVSFTLKENTAEVNKRKLIERITDEREKLEQTVEKIRVRLKKIEMISGEDLEDLKVLVAIRLPVFYTGLENIFKRIAREIDMDQPKGRDWHKDLLNQMASPHRMRPPVISRKLITTLNHILKFRHRFRNIYVCELELERVVENAQRVSDIFEELNGELGGFIRGIKTQTSDK